VDRIRHLLDAPDPVVWLFTGDSVTQGGRHLHGWRSYPELFGERVRIELGRTRDVVVNTAVGGWQVGDVAGDLHRSVTRFAPDVVLLGLGLNDSRHESAGVAGFAERYRDLCRRIADAGALPVPQTPNGGLPTSAPFVRPHLPAYADAIRGVAADLGLPLVDHFAVWQAADAPVDGEPGLMEHWMSQGCHPNGHGHRVMAHTVFRALGIFDPASPTCRLDVPG